VVASIVVALILIVPLVLLFAGGGGDDPERQTRAAGAMRVERFGAGVPELIVSVEPAANVPARAGGARSVTLRCMDADGQPVISQDEAWPFTDTDGDTLNPHTHVTLDANQLELVSRCRLIGTEPPLEAPLR
jgi:hypothetical protein